MSGGSATQLEPWSRTQIAGILAVSGVIVLIGSLFFAWASIPFGTDTPGIFDEADISGWKALEAGDALFVFIALMVVGMLATRRLEGPWLLVLALAAFAVLISFMISTVPVVEQYESFVSDGSFASEDAPGAGREFGSFIGVAGATLLLAAGVMLARPWLGANRSDPNE